MPLQAPHVVRALLTALLLAGCAAPAHAPAPAAPAASEAAAARNPLFPGADPHLVIADGRYWIYATTPGSAGDPRWKRLYAWVSRDLRTWTRTAPVFSLEGVGWIDDDGRRDHGLWAPALVQANGRYYLYYSVGPQTPEAPSRLGVAVGERPEGPFRDSGEPLLTGEWARFEAIDPMVFTDPKTGTPYLYVGGSNGERLRVFELERSMTALKREVPVEQPWHFTEAPFMHERDGVYYLSYSHGNWDRANYSVHYSTAPSPEGPWSYRDVILTSDASRKGPGHHAIVRNPATGDWFIAYHRWTRTRHGPYQGDREVALQRLVYDSDGAIHPVVMDDAPPPSSPLVTRPSLAPSG